MNPTWNMEMTQCMQSKYNYSRCGEGMNESYVLYGNSETCQAEEEGLDSLSTSLVEIGPRFVLNPIRIFRGSFGGQTLYQNPDYISPNASRAMARKAKGMAYED